MTSQSPVPVPVSVALIGFGLSGKYFHAPFLKVNPCYQITAVMQRHGEDSRAMFPQAALFRDFHELLRQANAELVIITTPNDTHFQLAMQALKAGKHVVVEKPVTLSTNEMAELMAYAEKNNQLLVPFHNRRFDSGFRTVQQMVQSGLIGEIVEAWLQFDRWRPQPRVHWRERALPGSGILYDLGPHLIDQALCLFGKPQAVTAYLGRQRPGAQVEDMFEIWLAYETLMVKLHAGMLVCDPTPRYLLRATGGAFVKYSDDPQEALLRQGHLPDNPYWGTEPPEAWGIMYKNPASAEAFPSLRGDYGLFYRQLYQAIRHQQKPPVTAMDGYHTIQLIELAMESHRSRQWLSLN
ncbi:MAG: Gfo/Idh/MocA family oxidoreductase [Thermoflavifilum aggregans]|nr:Gfo/Idh/MocA family oxidoreductase [Thermoflavifilum aggregans]